MIDQGKVLVFPTEESARSFSVSYVRSRRRGLLSSSVIAFDRFSAMFYGSSDADDAYRFIFAASAKRAPFRYFTSDSYDISGQLPPFIFRTLSTLDEVSRIRIKSREASHDAEMIRSMYAGFLSAMGLRDSVLEDPVLPPLDKDYVIVAPSAFPKERKLLSFLEGNSSISIAEPAREALSMDLFPNEKSEIRELFLRIRRLIDEGEDLADIVISTAAPDRLRPYLEKESYLFDIPLAFVAGISPLSAPSGRFLSLIAESYESGYAIETLKSLFLNTAMPFEDRSALRRFIARAVSDSILMAPESGRSDRFAKIPDEDGGAIYRAFRHGADALMTEKDPQKAFSHLMTLMQRIFREEQFGDDDVYSFAVDSFSSFCRAASGCIAAGYNPGPVFPLFMTYLEGQKYVSRDKEGVRIYPFGQDAALIAKHRFIITLTEDEAAKCVKDAAWFSDYEADRDEKDITMDILQCYRAASGNLRLSASSESYSGSVLPLMSLTERRCSLSEDDPWRFELRKDTRIYPLQRIGFERGLSSSLRIRKFSDDMTYSNAGKALPYPLALSYTMAERYEKCPYSYAMKYRFLLDENLSYVSSVTDHLEIGSRLHSVLEIFYNEGGRDPERRIPDIFDQEMALWKEGRRREKGEILQMRITASRPTDMQIVNLRKRFVPNLIEVVKAMNERSDIYEGGSEKKMSLRIEGKGFGIEGTTDRIARAQDGKSLILFDYKKGRAFGKEEADTKALQFYIYRILVEAKLKEKVSSACFVSLTDGKIRESRLEESNEKIIETLSEDAEGMMAGIWRAAPDDRKCGGCGFRGICRRRFSVQ